MSHLSNRQMTLPFKTDEMYKYHTVEVAQKGENYSVGKKAGVWCLVPENEAFQFFIMKDALAIKGAWNYEHPDCPALVVSHSRTTPTTEPCIWCGEEVPTIDIETHEKECNQEGDNNEKG